MEDKVNPRFKEQNNLKLTVALTLAFYRMLPRKYDLLSYLPIAVAPHFPDYYQMCLCPVQ